MVSEESIAEVSEVVRQKLVDLDSRGWQFEVESDRSENPDTMTVEFTHPLVPYAFSWTERLDTAARRIASWMEQHEEFQLIALSSSAVREERIPLLQGLVERLFTRRLLGAIGRGGLVGHAPRARRDRHRM